MEKYTLKQAIETMNEIASNPSPMAASLFTPADVLRILESITLPEAQPKRAFIPNEWINNFIHTLTEDLEDYQIIDHDSAEFELYHNEIRLESISVDNYNLRIQLERRLSSALEHVNSEIEYQEEREREKLEESTENTNSASESDSNC
jgi:hypothetical protein